MKFWEFEKIMSSKRMRRYVNACGGDTRKGMKLYRMNLHLAEEMFTIVGCYEVALRNAIDRIMQTCRNVCRRTGSESGQDQKHSWLDTNRTYNVILWDINHDQIMQNFDVVTGLFMNHVTQKSRKYKLKTI